MHEIITETKTSALLNSIFRLYQQQSIVDGIHEIGIIAGKNEIMRRLKFSDQLERLAFNQCTHTA